MGHKVNDEIRAEARRLRLEEGLSVRQIAVRLGRSVSRTHTYLKEAGVDMTPADTTDNEEK